jgi:mannose-6-phosphate isomerase-like protein (cupin superfamily)
MIVPPGRGEIVGDSPERRVEILCDDDALHATWSRFGPGREGADLHVHRHHTDVFYVLDGELTIRLGADGEEIVAPAGTVARVPPMVIHGFRNASAADVRYLNFHAPGAGFADYMRALRDGRKLTYDQEPPPADGARPAGEATIGPPPVAVDAIAIHELSGDADDVRYAYVLDGELTLPDGSRAPAGAWVRAAGARVSGAARYLSVRPA